MNTIRYSPYSRSQISRGGIDVQVYPFFNLGARRGEWSTARSGRFTRRNNSRYGLNRRLGRSQGRSGLVWKIPPPKGFYPLTSHPVASRYTDPPIDQQASLLYFENPSYPTCGYKIQLCASERKDKGKASEYRKVKPSTCKPHRRERMEVQITSLLSSAQEGAK